MSWACILRRANLHACPSPRELKCVYARTHTHTPNPAPTHTQAALRGPERVRHSYYDCAVGPGDAQLLQRRLLHQHCGQLHVLLPRRLHSRDRRLHMHGHQRVHSERRQPVRPRRLYSGQLHQHAGLISMQVRPRPQPPARQLVLRCVCVCVCVCAHAHASLSSPACLHSAHTNARHNRTRKGARTWYTGARPASHIRESIVSPRPCSTLKHSHPS